MARRTLPLLTGIGLAALLSAALAGCAAGAGDESAPPSGAAVSPGEGELTEVEIDAAWLDEGRVIGLITMGSSSCVPIVEDAGIQDNGTLGVILGEPPADTPCTRDMAPRVTLVTVPSGVDPSFDLEISVAGDTYYGDTELEGVPGLNPETTNDGGTPSAGWTDIDGMFVLLTWGSSSCTPVVASTEATGPAQVTVTLETPPTDQVCTLDFGARGTIATVTGLAENEGVELVLTGAEYTTPERPSITFPIYGSN